MLEWNDDTRVTKVNFLLSLRVKKKKKSRTTNKFSILSRSSRVQVPKKYSRNISPEGELCDLNDTIADWAINHEQGAKSSRIRRGAR